MLVYSTIKYATGVPVLPLNGATIAANTKIWIVYTPFVVSEAAYSFFDNGAKVGNNESQPPIEVNNGNGWTPAAGAHKLEVKNKTLVVIETANFTVGIATPPPTGKEPVTVNAKTDTTKVEVKFTITDSKTGVVTPVN